ncbi:low temperature requirement protein A [Micromonospora wenchangensis]|uniref:Low temperature requirement protein A n=1 Tax=Micromonospora wenchangensis TaxID=1185415 RepID=A0A246RMQ3_9ACTN|nr:low temperature requirement protein A [Micromonospora wenchangensis]OWV06832.1 low temperature requirement protein A [Micromonospora wenchangensis]
MGKRQGSDPAVRPVGEDHRATPFELFFDLVYVFATTQITAYLAHEHSPYGVLRGLLVLALLWGTWSGYTWLGNHSRADEGLLRAGMVGAMAAMFVVALAVPEAWRDAPGGLPGPVVLVCAYLLVRWVHLAVYAVAATGDAGLRQQIAVTWPPLLVGAALLLCGALLGGWAQVLLFGVALLVDWAGIYLTARRGAWRLHSPAHLTERHGLFVILALGESTVAIGVGAAGQPVGVPLLTAAVLGVGTAVCLWWLYFDVVAPAARRRLVAAHDAARVSLAVDAYTYGHFPLVAGIVLTALGVEGVVANADETGPLGAFYALSLYGGAALYLAGHLLFERLVHRATSLPRLVTAGVLAAAGPAAAVLAPMAGLAGLVAVLTVLIVVETRRHRRNPRPSVMSGDVAAVVGGPEPRRIEQGIARIEIDIAPDN